jgi:putative membrane protein
MWNNKERSNMKNKIYRRVGAVSLSALMVAAMVVPAAAAEAKGEKEETVYIQANADGSPREVTVETALRELGEGTSVTDRSDLTDIKNTEGDEEYTQSADGALIWENHGEDIQYEGKTDQEVPVGVKVTYSLDGKEISADDLAGQSGRVTIRFDYTNTAKRTVTIENTGYEVCVPFAALSVATLDTDKFTNVEVTNGKLVHVGDTTLVAGIAFPGLEDSLALDSYDAELNDIDIPDYVEFSADVTDFSLDFTATIFFTGVFPDLDLDDLDSVDELQENMEKLTDASSQLVDGTAQFSDGLGEFQTYLVQYLTGTDALAQGAGQLSDGLTALDSQSSQLTDGLTALNTGLQQVTAALSGLSLGNDSGLTAASEQIQTDAAALETVLIQLQTFLTQVDTYSADVETQTATAQKALDSIDLTAVDDAVRENIEAAKAALAAMPEKPELDCTALIQSVNETAADLQAQLAVISTNMAGLAQMAGQLTAFQSSVQGLADGSQALTSGFAQYAEAVNQLATGAVQLKQGADTLSTAGAALSSGFATITEAGSTLADGMKTFDEEGIQALSDLTGDDLTHFVQRLKALKQADESYTNFAGLAEGMTGSVRFLIETDEVGE